jgi:hypothetical protein
MYSRQAAPGSERAEIAEWIDHRGEHQMNIRQRQIESVAWRLAELRDYVPDYTWEDATRDNRDGWTIDLSRPEDNHWVRYAGVVLGESELRAAWDAHLDRQ